MIDPFHSQEEISRTSQKPVLIDGNMLRLRGETIPLLSGEVQFFRMPPEAWEPCLRAVKKMGLPIVSTYLSWRRFALGVDEYDLLGKTDPHLNLPRFLELCRDLGLWVILKPGPWICAEETNGGYPDWLVSDPELQVLDCQDRPVQGYNPPFQSPIPSYFHPKYQGYVQRWLEAVDQVILPYTYPNGPILLVQLDNEPGFTFHDRMFESDYNPYVANKGGLYSQWLKKKYEGCESLPVVYAQENPDMGRVCPPRTLRISKQEELTRYWDWVEFKEWLLAGHVRSICADHQRNGLTQVLFTTNYNDHPQLATPNDWHRLEAAGDIGGFDYYPTLPMRSSDFAKMVKALNYSRSVNRLAWSPEIMCGIWSFEGQPHTAIDLSPADFEYLYLTCLAYGLKGMNFYMLADRDNWVGSPLDIHGQTSPTAQAVEKTNRLMNTIPHFFEMDCKQPLGVAFYHPYAREAFIANETATSLGNYQLGDAYAHFEQVYRDLLELNLNPGLIDLWVNPQALHNYRLVILPAGSYMDRQAQQALVDYVLSGGILVVYPALPFTDLDFKPLSLLETLGDAPKSSDSDRIGFNKKGALIVSTGASPLKEQLKSLADKFGVTPEVTTSDPSIMTVIQHGKGEEILFVINPDDYPRKTDLLFEASRSGELVEVLDPTTVLAIKNRKSHIELSPRTVRVFYCQRESAAFSAGITQD